MRERELALRDLVLEPLVPLRRRLLEERLRDRPPLRWLLGISDRATALLS